MKKVLAQIWLFSVFGIVGLVILWTLASVVWVHPTALLVLGLLAVTIWAAVTIDYETD